MMNYYEWETFIDRLQLSVRSRNILCRAYRMPNDYRLNTPQGQREAEICKQLNSVETYKDFKDVFETIYTKIPACGKHTYDEIMAALDNLTEKKEKAEWHKIADGLPKCGYPLIVKTRDSMSGITAIKYPVYYIQDSYELNFKWCFFPACEGMTVLLPDYSEVLEWKYVSTEMEDEK